MTAPTVFQCTTLPRPSPRSWVPFTQPTGGSYSVLVGRQSTRVIGLAVLSDVCHRDCFLHSEGTRSWLLASLTCPHVALVQGNKSLPHFNRGLSPRAAARVPWSLCFRKHPFLPRVLRSYAPQVTHWDSCALSQSNLTVPSAGK